MIDDPRRPAPSRTWLVTVGSAVAVVVVVAVVGLAAGGGHHRTAASLSGVVPSPNASLSVLPSPSPSDLPSNLLSPSASDATAAAVATATPLPSPTGPVPTAPAGFYFCEGQTGMATCADGTGTPTRQTAIAMLGPNDETYNPRDGTIYYREALSDAHGNVERISRVPLAGGTPQILVQGPSMLNETQVAFGSPISSPDGDFLAYGQMTLAFDVPGGPTQTPSPGAQTVGPPSGPPNAPVTTRLVQIKIQNLHNLKVPTRDRASVDGEQRYRCLPAARVVGRTGGSCSLSGPEAKSTRSLSARTASRPVSERCSTRQRSPRAVRSRRPCCRRPAISLSSRGARTRSTSSRFTTEPRSRSAAW